jgi:hypothetical protein
VQVCHIDTNTHTHQCPCIHTHVHTYTGGSPCTAMVFVWCAIADGDAAYTLVQVALNDCLILVLYAPTLFLLLGATGV